MSLYFMMASPPSGGSADSPEGPLYPGAAASEVNGPYEWTNPNNAFLDDGVFTTAVSAEESEGTHFLELTDYGFAIPDGSTIDGIVVEIKRKASADGADFASDSEIKLIQGGAATGDSKPSASHWPTAVAYETYGDDSDLWGLTWTAAQINAADFGVSIAASLNYGSADVTASIDTARITVYFS